ncbi:transcription termination factor 4, mitochondrial [Oryctolagus cuniculus]|nr:transcription termination factor 4, mitochondrial isoform X3 [Oryctolagus cuniculus]
MAALGRKVLAWRRLPPPAWASAAERTPPPAAGLRRRTAASRGGGREEPCGVGPGGRPSADAAPSPLDRVAGSLLDMGFAEAQVRELLGLQPAASPQQLLDVVSEFMLLGVDPGPVCVALRKSPQLLKLPVPRVRKRSAYLRRLGLAEGKLKRVLHCCPEVFTMHQQHVEGVVGVLKGKCLFSAEQVTEILHRCPQVLREDPGDLEYKFQYAYFRMGIKHLDIVRSDFLQYSVTKIKQRHTYLERLGRYQTPDKKGQTQIPNPLLKDVLRVSEAEFLARTACSSAEEFEVFKKLLAREEEEVSESGDEDGDEGEGEEGEQQR